MEETRHNLATRLTEQAAARGDAVALVWRGDAVTFAALEDRVARTAAGFRRRGLGPGDRVLLLHRLSPRLYIALLATWRVGAAAALVDPGVGLPGFAKRVHRLRPGFVRLGRFPGLLPIRRGRAGAGAIEPVAPGNPALLTTT